MAPITALMAIDWGSGPVTGAIVAVSGTLAAFLTKMLLSRKDELFKLREELRQEVKELKGELKKLQDENMTCARENLLLRARIMELEYKLIHIPGSGITPSPPAALEPGQAQTTYTTVVSTTESKPASSSSPVLQTPTVIELEKPH
jgi:hypothetical protein